jgi:hypothetical protein
MKKLVKIILLALIFIVILFLAAFCYLFLGPAPKAKNITWGVDFSQMQAEALKLNWKEAYLAMIEELGAKNIKLHTQWDWVEGTKDDYYFDDIDWQIKKAEEKDVKIIYVVGMKTGRWPECHIPDWAKDLSKDQQQEEVLKYIEKVVLRYKDSGVISFWQVENEPLFDFGKCPPWYYDGGEFLKKEVELVKSLDPSREIIISDSGELSWWTGAAKIGDMVGTTMYRKAWVNINNNFGFSGNFYPTFYGTYPLPPVFYWRKAQLIKNLFGKKVICIELQAEPWAEKPFYDIFTEEQQKTMDLEQFKSNVKYAKNMGLDTFYFWGAEWWYWMKEEQGSPEIWNEAQKLFN